MKLTFLQQQTFNYIMSKGNEVKCSEAGINFTKSTVNALIKKGLVKEEQRERLRADDNEMVFWSVYKIVTPLTNALQE